MRSHPNRPLATIVTTYLAVLALIPFLPDTPAASFSSVRHVLPSGLFPLTTFPTGTQGPPSMMQMPLVLPLFLQDGNFSSTLVMVNGTALPTYADAVLTTLDGSEITRQRVEFAPHSQQQIDIYTLLQSVLSPATTGRIMVMQSPELNGMAIAAQLSITYNGSMGPNYLDEEATMPNPNGSQVMRTVVDKTDGSPLVAITSLSNTPQEIAIECFANPGVTFSKSVELRAQETLVTEACTDRPVYSGDVQAALAEQVADGKQGEPHSAAISLRTDGMAGSFAAFGLAAHANEGHQYFSALAFSDPKTLLSSSTVFTGVPVGSSPLLPEGKFTPELTLANFSPKPAHVNIKYSRTTDGAPSMLDAASVIVPPSGTKTLVFDNLLGDSQLRNSFLVISDAPPGDLMSKLVSRSDSSTLREVELLAKDESDQANGGMHPWSIENDTESTLLLFNHSSSAQKVSVMIGGGGPLWQKVYELQSMETLAISLRDLISNQVKDDKGKTLSMNSLQGEAGWFTAGPGVGKGRLLQSNRTSAMARSFSCFAYTVLCPGYTSPQDIITSPPFTVGSQNVLAGSISGTFCSSNGPQFPGGPVMCSGPSAGSSATGYTAVWSSDNQNIATVASGSGANDVYANGVGVGQTYLRGILTDRYNCHQTAPVEANVTPRIDSISPSRGLIGATTSVTIAGKGFGTNPTFNAPSGITATVNSASDTQIQAGFAVSASATTGNNSITVNASSQTSNSFTFYVQVPTSLSVLSSQVISMTQYCPDPSKMYGILVAIHYQVLDQNGSPIASAAMEPQEEQLNAVLNGVSQGNPLPNWKDVGPSNYPGTSQFTDTNGQYWDAPVGACSPGAFTLTFTQPVSVLVNGTRYPSGGGAVRTNNWSIQSSSSGHGSIKNGTDVNQSH